MLNHLDVLSFLPLLSHFPTSLSAVCVAHIHDKEIGPSFLVLFRKAAVNPAELVKICPDAIPQSSHKIFNGEHLTEKDMLDLPPVAVYIKKVLDREDYTGTAKQIA